MVSSSNPLGIPSIESPAAPRLAALLHHMAGDRTLDSVNAQVLGDIRIVTEMWPRRWYADAPPPKLRPADLLVARGVACGADTGAFSETAERALAYGLPGVGDLARLTIDATPYWVPGSVAQGLARTDIPDTDADAIRLPNSAVSVWFREPLTVTGPLSSPEIERWVSDHSIATGVNLPDGMPWPLVAAALTTTEAKASTVIERRIGGMVLLADDDGRPIDACIWVTLQHYSGGEWAGQWLWNLVPGIPSLSAWPELWWGLCAIVAWGDWLDDRPIVVHNRGKAKRLAKLGFDPSKIGPVRVMKARHLSTLGRERPETTAAGPSPTTHLRRGHWRRQRVGPGRERVEMRWIAPTVVNPGHEGDWRETVFALPPVESIPDTPLPNMFKKLKEDPGGLDT